MSIYRLMFKIKRIPKTTDRIKTYQFPLELLSLKVSRHVLALGYDRFKEHFYIAIVIFNIQTTSFSLRLYVTDNKRKKQSL